MSERQALVGGFQQNKDPQSDPIQNPPVYLQEFRPRVLSRTASVLGVGFTLTESCKLIQLEPNYSTGSDSQVFKRIHCIGQTKDCTIWKLIREDSPDELAVLRRAGEKENFIAKAYALTKTQKDELDAEMDVVEIGGKSPEAD